ncbi:hypothetical protein OG21DRAFT_1603605, partial [Imleria badia]
MLTVGPNSMCDVCMESYMDGTGMPHAITCGHIFCRACLDSMQPQCPICRDQFSPEDIRELRVDSDTPSSTMVAPRVDAQVQHLLDDIARTANGGATLEEMQRVVDLCDVYHTGITQPDAQLSTPLGVSYLLLSTLLEAKRRLHSQADQLSEVTAARDDIRDRLTMELDVAQLRCQHSEQAWRDEREAGRRNEKALRVHYDEMNALWRRSVESMQLQYQSLRKELDLSRQINQLANHGKASSVVERSNTAIPRQTVAEGNSSRGAAKPNKVEPHKTP